MKTVRDARWLINSFGRRGLRLTDAQLIGVVATGATTAKPATTNQIGWRLRRNSTFR